MNSVQPNDHSNDFADKANTIIEKIRSLKKNYENCLMLDKEFHELKTITVEIQKHQLKYNFYMDAIGKQVSTSANCGNELSEKILQ